LVSETRWTRTRKLKPNLNPNPKNFEPDLSLVFKIWVIEKFWNFHTLSLEKIRFHVKYLFLSTLIEVGTDNEYQIKQCNAKSCRFDDWFLKMNGKNCKQPFAKLLPPSKPNWGKLEMHFCWWYLSDSKKKSLGMAWAWKMKKMAVVRFYVKSILRYSKSSKTKILIIS